MSYRHSSYRKMSKAVSKAMRADAMTEIGADALTRAEMNRVLHWSNRPALPKPLAWGKPKKPTLAERVMEITPSEAAAMGRAMRDPNVPTRTLMSRGG